ncbi:hypothetical protein SAM23877_0303 [Streptomyces ambofaciens ATCC 23877]|uniref:Uncharacterized protein n=1 Tax=Streptomyces ambofaciens (strain ATCC 23877 / 3486 / DSM 40053 / JCM 4204 / NBRC 12836 / NRRL B-2516) TaxID=278992 RepID=A0A0K2AKG5_STRA7|nr:hypothetical protein SAM23877_0303 [Streptomyces ambofaciens ATCC 23877]
MVGHAVVQLACDGGALRCPGGQQLAFGTKFLLLRPLTGVHRGSRVTRTYAPRSSGKPATMPIFTVSQGPRRSGRSRHGTPSAPGRALR